MLTSIGEEIRRAREAQGFTICRLAIEAGIDRSNLNNIELGKSDPRISTVKKILDALGLKSKEELGLL